MPTAPRRNRASRSSSSCARSLSPTQTCPEVGRSSPPITINSVDLPEPDGPTMATRSPGATVRSMPRRMLTGPAALSSFRWMSTRRIISELAAGSKGGTSLSRNGRASGYGAWTTACQALILACALLTSPALAQPLRILALGDSLTAGYGLGPGQGFAAQLQKALGEKGVQADVIDGGVSGDTTAGGLSRLD